MTKSGLKTNSAQGSILESNLRDHEQLKFVSGSHLWQGKIDYGLGLNLEEYKAIIIESIILLHEGFPDWRLSLKAALPWKPAKALSNTEIEISRGSHFDATNLEKAKVVKIWLKMLENMGIEPVDMKMTFKQDQLQYVAEVLLPLFARGRAMLQGTTIKALIPSKLWPHRKLWDKIEKDLKDTSGKSLSSDWKKVMKRIATKGLERIQDAVDQVGQYATSNSQAESENEEDFGKESSNSKMDSKIRSLNIGDQGKGIENDKSHENLDMQLLMAKMVQAMENLNVSNLASTKKISKVLKDVAQKVDQSKAKEKKKKSESHVVQRKSNRKKKVDYSESTASKEGSICSDESGESDDEEEYSQCGDASEDGEESEEEEDDEWTAKKKTSSQSKNSNSNKSKKNQIMPMITISHPPKFSGDNEDALEAEDWFDSLEKFVKLQEGKLNPVPKRMIRSLLAKKALNWWLTGPHLEDKLRWAKFRKLFRERFMNVKSQSAEQAYWLCERKLDESCTEFLERVYVLGMKAKVQMHGLHVVEQWLKKLPSEMRKALNSNPPADLRGVLENVRRLENFDSQMLDQKLLSSNNLSTKKFRSSQMVCTPCQNFEDVLEVKGEIYAASVKKRMPPCAHDNHEAGSCFKQLFCTNCDDYGHMANSVRCKFCPLCDKVVHRPDQPCAVIEYCRAQRSEIPKEIVDKSAENSFKHHLNSKDQRN